MTALAFAGRQLLSVSHDGTALIWDTAGLKPDAKGTAGQDRRGGRLGGAGRRRRGQGVRDDGPARASAPEAAVGLLRERLKPVDAADAKRIDG